MTTAKIEPIYIEIGSRIRELREAKGMTQSRLAMKLGMLRASMSNIEHGNQRVMLHTLLEIAAVLERPLTDFIPGTNSTERSLSATEIAANLEFLRQVRVVFSQGQSFSNAIEKLVALHDDFVIATRKK